MNNKRRALKIIEDNLTLVTDKIEDVKNWNKAIPTLNRAEEELEWEGKAISALPDEVIEMDIITTLDSSYNYWVTAVGDPSNLYPATTSAVAINVSGSSGIYTKLEYYAKGNPKKDLPEILVLEYQEIQRTQHVKEIISSKLKTIRQIKPSIGKKPPIGDLFDDAMKAIEHAKTETEGMEAVGITMRNVLEEFKGTLFYRSHAFKKGDKSKWEKMAMSLVKNGADSLEYTTLLKEYDTYTELHENLSQLAKRGSELSEPDIDSLVTKFLTHFEVVLDLIDIDEFI